ncbi:lanthionine synthetase C family protein [Streptomyces sp. NBC_00820]|uniref:lanthionine synthetase C family protein n=1 Tax=Streptomyces sp. NBC_00820 TaxID=2975842 RepID=UPI002ED01D2C|nr:lanthionine synthetase C family protein [Streptomyces sp. NBC_00820]
MFAVRTHDATLASRQSLTHGSLGVALLHVVRAHRGSGQWPAIQRQLSATGPLIDGAAASLYYGAPAMSYVLHVAAAGTDRYAGALNTLDRIVAALTRRRLAAAHARVSAGRFASHAEYDVIGGLTGLGALLLRRQPSGPELTGVLDYLVRLTEPVTVASGANLPGWWSGRELAVGGVAPADGRAMAGMAHGIAGPLALLALAKQRGITVAGHDEAMRRICRWLDQIRVTDHRGTRWPRWISAQGPAPAIPAAPSWCSGTPGLARAQQLAGIALGDADRKRMAERSLLMCLADHQQLDQIVDRSLCHGFGGLLRTVQRVAEDAEDPHRFANRLKLLDERFRLAGPPEETGFLTGAAGAILAYQSLDAATPCDWDMCLLLA